MIVPGPLQRGQIISATLFVTNLTDTIYPTGEFDTYYSLDVVSKVYGEPRMFGARIRYDFGAN